MSSRWQPQLPNQPEHVRHAIKTMYDYLYQLELQHGLARDESQRSLPGITDVSKVTEALPDPPISTIRPDYVLAPLGFIGALTNISNNLFVSAVDQVNAWQFVLPFDITVRRMAVGRGSTFGSTYHFGIGIYNALKTRVLNTGSVTITAGAAAGVSTFTVSPAVTLRQGLYWLAGTSDTTGAVFLSVVQNVLIQNRLKGFKNVTENRNVAAGTASSPGTLPLTLSPTGAAPNNTGIPLLFLSAI